MKVLVRIRVKMTTKNVYKLWISTKILQKNLHQKFKMSPDYLKFSTLSPNKQAVLLKDFSTNSK